MGLGKMEIPYAGNYLSIQEVEKSWSISEYLLNELIQAGKIRFMTINETLLICQDDLITALPKEQQPEYKKFADLAGLGIGMREASRKYHINHKTISRWVERGFIKILSREGRKVLIDARDMAYCAEIYFSKNAGQGRWLFNAHGAPYIKKS